MFCFASHSLLTFLFSRELYMAVYFLDFPHFVIPVLEKTSSPCPAFSLCHNFSTFARKMRLLFWLFSSSLLWEEQRRKLDLFSVSQNMICDSMCPYREETLNMTVFLHCGLICVSKRVCSRLIQDTCGRRYPSHQWELITASESEHQICPQSFQFFVVKFARAILELKGRTTWNQLCVFYLKCICAEASRKMETNTNSILLKYDSTYGKINLPKRKQNDWMSSWNQI